MFNNGVNVYDKMGVGLRVPKAIWSAESPERRFVPNILFEYLRSTEVAIFAKFSVISVKTTLNPGRGSLPEWDQKG